VFYLDNSEVTEGNYRVSRREQRTETINISENYRLVGPEGK
jgi:hypothetical protein